MDVVPGIVPGRVEAVAGYSAAMNSKPAMFDELDRKIITALMANARTSFAEIGAAIGLSATAVKRRVDRLRETGVITGFTATVKPVALGWRTEAYVEVYCEGAAPPRRLAEVVRNHPEITAAMTVTGGAAHGCRAQRGSSASCGVGWWDASTVRNGGYGRQASRAARIRSTAA